jgi:3-hydroxyisobutyrate dehydrogenase
VSAGTGAGAAAATGPVLFVGLGAMGTPMSTRLAGAGHQLLLCDADADRALALAGELGGTAVERADLQDAAAGAATVVLMLPDSTVVESVLLGDSGLLSALPAGALVVDMSSSRPASTVSLAHAAAAQDVVLVDAPVSGGVAKARTGELSIMVGAPDDAAVERVRPLLSAMGTDITHVGPPGAGHAVKALNNLLSAIGMAGASEVLAVAANFGLEPQTVLDVLNRSTGRNQATEVKFARFVLSRAFDSGFSMALMVKDLRTAIGLAHDTGTPVPMAASALEEWTAALRTMPPGADHTHIAAYVEGRAGTELRAPEAD